ncbi:MAG: N-glycosylase/DNA lyase [Archaeoglobus sp.]|nr:N-glycosylase/DNA lyase [Archaeoglobus sp.]
MLKLISQVEKLKPAIQGLVKKRIDEFISFKFKGNEEWFSELCFCILTANSSAEVGIRIQNELGYEGFAELSERELAIRLKELGYRFYNVRAGYIVKAREYLDIKDRIHGLNAREAREWLVNNVKGIGYKEASHFLRNTGNLELAILDRHILRILEKNGIIEVPNSLTRKKYLEIEQKFLKLAGKLRIQAGELDLYLWYLSTGKVLK